MQGGDPTDGGRNAETDRRAGGLTDLALFVGAGILPHILGAFFSTTTAELMRGVSDFAVEVTAERQARFGTSYRTVAFSVTSVAVASYLWPIIAWSWRAEPPVPDARVRRRLVSAPLALALITFAPWLGAIVFTLATTIAIFGRWSSDLLSSQVFSPLISGFLASCTTYLAVEWLVRARTARFAFPGGDLGDARDALSLGVRSRLLLLMFAVGFTPAFTALGLAAAARERASAGAPAFETLDALTAATAMSFLCFLALGVVYTLLLARSLTRPLGVMAAALGRVERGDLAATVQVESNDETGVLAAGVNTMVTTLREREHILATFGRVVEPDVRDRLLAGDLEAGGEQRRATVLFCDLRGFTTMAEGQPPREVLALLNRFFGEMSDWAHQCGGFVDKFIGDAILVVFGLFGDDDEASASASAAAALRCAEGIDARLEHLAADGGRALRVAVGVHSGEVLAGTIGAADRHEYTVVGDTVNVAARLVEQCKHERVSLLVSARTVELARRAGYGGRLVEHEAVQLRGREQPVTVYTS